MTKVRVPRKIKKEVHKAERIVRKMPWGNVEQFVLIKGKKPNKYNTKLFRALYRETRLIREIQSKAVLGLWN